MGLSKEILRPTETGTAFSFASASPLEMFPKKDTGAEAMIREFSQMLSAESKDKKEADEQPQKEATRKDGFEPFVNPEPPNNPLFINGYIGNFAQAMELNRVAVERVLKIANLEGQVFLTSLSFSRQRSLDGANPDGSVAAKKNGEIDHSQKEINPSYRTVPTIDGWRIEINDRKIIENLNEKKLTGEKRQKTFIKKFSRLLSTSLFECIRKEKTTGIKDEHFGRKFFISVSTPAIGLFIFAPKLLQLDSSAIAGFTSTYFALNAGINLLSLFHRRLMESHDTNSSAYIGRKLDALWEYLMPQVEVDKVARSFLSLKARALVKEKKPEIK